MDILNIDYDGLLPHIIEVYTHIYGEEYRSIITERVNKCLILSYLDPNGISDYVSYLKGCKSREFAMEFLHRIGFDTQPYKKANFTEPLNPKAEELLMPYINKSYLGMDINFANRWAPLCAFDPNNVDPSIPDYENILFEQRIQLINHLRGENKDKITKDTFPAFSETDEYSKILERINDLRIIHDELFTKLGEWGKCLVPYEEYVNSERKRRENIFREKTNEIFAEIFSDLPSKVKASITEKNTNEQQKMLLMVDDLSSRFPLESFRSEQMRKLNSPCKYIDKVWIIYFQKKYFDIFGLDLPKITGKESENEINKYLEFLNCKDVEEYLPSEELITRIAKLREKKYEEGLKEYYSTRTDFVNIMKSLDNGPHNFENVYDNIVNKRVCILGKGGNKDGEFAAVMFYTPIAYGRLFGTLLHEFGHVIDQTKKGCGFEPIETYDNGEKNPYDNKFRKYEKYNETIDDMFKMEAEDFFRSRGIYHIEPQEFVFLDTSDQNTFAITKNLLRPLLHEFRKKVINAKVNVDQTELTSYIGRDNFEGLVDAVNKVDYLCRNGLIDKIKKSPNDPMVIKYQEQVARVEQIYIQIYFYTIQQKLKNLSLPSDSQVVGGISR